MEFHDVANLFPLIEGQEFDALVRDIKENGLQQPIWTYQGKIIDGRNRYRACLKASVEPRYQEWDGKGSLISFVISLNVKRRHLTSSQLAAIALEVEKQLAKENPVGRPSKDDGNYGNISVISGESREKAANLLGTNPHYVTDAKKIAANAPELINHVIEGTLTIPDAKLIAELPAESRSTIIERVTQKKEEEGKRVSGAVRDAVWEEKQREIEQAVQVRGRGIPDAFIRSDFDVQREMRREEARERIEQLRDKGVELPTGKYSCLVVDPPWPMQKIERDVRPNQVEFDYPTMSEEELKAFPLPGIASEDCHLYLWTTQKHLPLALRLAEHWGFKYQCLMTWRKNVGFTPFSWMYSTEHALFCTKGSLPLLKLGKRLDFEGVGFEAKVREHSRKPDEFYDIVREVSPGPRIDVFSREKRDGFDQHGNEVEKFASA